MSDPSTLRRIVRFGLYRYDFSAGELHKNGIKVKVSDQPLHLLEALLERPGEMLTRRELGDRLWPAGTFAGFEDSLNTAVNKLRAALGDEAENPRFIETIPRRGYRFIAAMEVEPSAPAADGQDLPGIRNADARASRTPVRIHSGIWLVTLGAVLVSCLAAWYGWWHLRQRVAPASIMPIHSIAVLPFENLSGDPKQDYFADGMTDELITDLAQVGSLQVISRSSVMAYKNARNPIREIRRELHADAVIEGSVIRSQGSVRVDARLIETSDGRHLWAQSFTQEEQNIVNLQDDVAEAIAERVEVAIEPSVRARLGNARPVNAEAYEAYLHGTSYLEHHSDADLLKSLDYFKQATAIDPTLAVAYAGTAQAYCDLGDDGVLPDSVVWPQAETAAQRAIDLDDSIGNAHAAMAFALWRYEWNWKGAETEFRRALELNPNDSDTHHEYAIFLATTGDFPFAERELGKAQELDPRSSIIRTSLGRLSYYQRDYAKAIADYQGVLQADRNFVRAHNELWIAYALEGEQPQASRELDEVFRLFHHADLAERVSAEEEGASAGVRLRAEVLSYANSGYLTTYEKARFLAFAGEKREALKALQNAEKHRDTRLVYARIEPVFASLHSSPQFQHLLAAIGPRPH